MALFLKVIMSLIYLSDVPHSMSGFRQWVSSFSQCKKGGKFR